MAQSFLGKIGILLSASLHSLLDRALQQNSLAVFDEYIRQARDSMVVLQGAVGDLGGSVRTLKRKYDEESKEAAALDIQIDTALRTGKETLAKAMQTKLNTQIGIAHTYQEQHDRQAATVSTLTEMMQILQAKVDVLTNQREQVAVLLDLIKSKNQAVTSIKDVQKITDNQTKAIMDDVQSQLDVADSRMEMATSRLTDQIDQEVGNVELDAQLEDRRKRLGLS